MKGIYVNKQCPDCKTAYNIADADVGREFTCFKCNAGLVVRKDGIRLANAAPPALSPAEPDAPAVELQPRLASREGLAGFPRLAGRLADVPTWSFGIGAFLVIMFLFFPLINHAKVARAKATIDAGQLKEDRLERELKQKAEEGKNISPADEELRKKARQTWAREKASLQDDAEEVSLAARRSDYWYTWGMMLGFWFLAGSALAYLNPAQPTIRRVVGAIVIVAEVLLIFLKYLLLPAQS
jgi:hypothetical protein